MTVAMIGMQELLIVMAILLLLFGSTKLPALARSMGSSITQFKKGLREEPEQLSERTGGAEKREEPREGA